MLRLDENDPTTEVLFIFTAQDAADVLGRELGDYESHDVRKTLEWAGINEACVSAVEQYEFARDES